MLKHSHTPPRSPAAMSFSDKAHGGKHSVLLTHVSSAVLSTVEVEIEIGECACQIVKTLALLCAVYVKFIP